MVVIVNPKNGPIDPLADPYNFYRVTICMQLLADAGVQMVGYVSTKQAFEGEPGAWTQTGLRSEALIQADIELYASSYPGVTGIFLDEVSNFWQTDARHPDAAWGDHSAFYRRLFTMVGQDMKLFINPGGAFVPEWLSDLVNDGSRDAGVVVFEGAKDRWDPQPETSCKDQHWTSRQGDFGPGPWCPLVPVWDGVDTVVQALKFGFYSKVGHSRVKFAALVHGYAGADDAAASISEAIESAESSGLDMLYLTDAEVADPWSGLPSYWDALVEGLVASNTNGTELLCEQMAPSDCVEAVGSGLCAWGNDGDGETDFQRCDAPPAPGPAALQLTLHDAAVVSGLPTTSALTGCMCYWDESRFDCACCAPGSCQCEELNRHVCVLCDAHLDDPDICTHTAASDLFHFNFTAVKTASSAEEETETTGTVADIDVFYVVTEASAVMQSERDIITAAESAGEGCSGRVRVAAAALGAPQMQPLACDVGGGSYKVHLAAAVGTDLFLSSPRSSGGAGCSQMAAREPCEDFEWCEWVAGGNLTESNGTEASGAGEAYCMEAAVTRCDSNTDETSCEEAGDGDCEWLIDEEVCADAGTSDTTWPGQGGPVCASFGMSKCRDVGGCSWLEDLMPEDMPNLFVYERCVDEILSPSPAPPTPGGSPIVVEATLEVALDLSGNDGECESGADGLPHPTLVAIAEAQILVVAEAARPPLNPAYFETISIECGGAGSHVNARRLRRLEDGNVATDQLLPQTSTQQIRHSYRVTITVADVESGQAHYSDAGDVAASLEAAVEGPSEGPSASSGADEYFIAELETSLNALDGVEATTQALFASVASSAEVTSEYSPPSETSSSGDDGVPGWGIGLITIGCGLVFIVSAALFATRGGRFLCDGGASQTIESEAGLASPRAVGQFPDESPVVSDDYRIDIATTYAC